MRPNLENQVAVVTGASRGIGRAIVSRLAAAGCKVAALARSPEDLADTLEHASAGAAHKPLAIPADVTRDAEVERALRIVIERLGRIAILVNNAGFAPPRATIGKTSLSDWDRTLFTCLRAPMVLTRLVLPDMLAHRQGAIVNIASIASKRGRSGEAAYAAAKFGLLGFTQSVYEEVHNHGIKVCAICPGPVDTGLIPPNKKVDRAKFLQPHDIADLVYQIVSSPIRMCPVEIVVEPQFDPEG